MGAPQQLLVAGAAGVNQQFIAFDIGGDSPPGDFAEGSIIFISNGTMSFAGVVSLIENVTPSTNWYLPTTTGIGSLYWLRLTGASLTTNPASTFTAMSSSLTATKSANTSNASASFTVEIASDSGGTNIVLTRTGCILRYTHT